MMLECNRDEGHSGPCEWNAASCQRTASCIRDEGHGGKCDKDPTLCLKWVERTEHPTTPAVSFTADAKDTNPKDAVGITKVPISVVPLPVLGEVGVALLEGALKYGRHNYRDAGVRASVYFDAVVLRHLGAWWEGEDTDPDSDLSHVTKAIAGLMVLRDSMMRGNWVDDRPPKCAAGWVAELNKKTAALRAKYPDPKAPHTEKKP